mmetsp:Transcript_12367/g.15381  ORF Transcript_12367/g.15381 Transcript_12367/m.15381 type:complete len:295 (-) Transcript_12367:24-908(-)
MEYVALTQRDVAGSGSLAMEQRSLSEFPEEVFSGRYWNLKSLILRDNLIAKVPLSLNRLYFLIDLDLTHNQITKIEPDAFRGLRQLSVLVLSHNSISDMKPFLSMVNLKALYLSNNQISHIPDEINQLTQLRVLHLNNNHIKAIPSTISRLTALTSLHIAGNKISVLPEEISNMKQLQKLSLEDNEFPFSLNAIIPSVSAYERASLVMRASRIKRNGWSPVRHLWLSAAPRVQISFILWGIKNDIKPISLLPMEIWSMIFDILCKEINVSTLRFLPKPPATKLLSRMKLRCCVQ